MEQAQFSALATVFFGDEVAGNVCKVIIVQQSLNMPASLSGEYTQCVSQHQSNGSIEVACWTASGNEIMCCGHGLLASAACWLNNMKQTKVTLHSKGSHVVAYCEQDLYWLSFSRYNLIPCDVPDWIGEIFDTRPVTAAKLGENNGYLVLEWASGFSLTSLIVPNERLSRFTSRALIVTTMGQAETQFPKANIQYRYFAPQYGVPEDPATGSAMRVLAEYWYQKAGFLTLQAHQCSPTGGVLHSQLQENFIKVGGKVRISRSSCDNPVEDF